ncbi:MAG: sensor histidine kinase [Gemmatimonadaceae bacterium]
MSTSPLPVSAALSRRAGNERRLPRWLDWLLRVPLVAKIAGANGIIVVAAIGSAVAVMDRSGHDATLVLILAVALAGASVVNVALVLIALRPLADLEVTAQRIWRGDLSARVPRSIVADSDLLRVGGALNIVLDGLISDRQRLRAMTSHVLQAADEERSRIAGELHDSAAQTLAGLTLELSAAAKANRDAELGPRLDRARQMSAGVLDEIKMLAHTMYPRVLEDGDLGAALEHLAREISLRTGVPVVVENDSSASEIPSALTSVLYRVAQEAVNNAVRHGHPTGVKLLVRVQNAVACLEVVDDGSGFDVVEAEGHRPGMGIYTMRERAALLGGAVEIHSGDSKGTRIVVCIPLISPVEDAALAPAGSAGKLGFDGLATTAL